MDHTILFYKHAIGPNYVLPGPPSGPSDRRKFAIKLDRTDRAILAVLQKDAGLSNKELARKVRLAPSSCLQRVRRLKTSGVLHGLHAEVDPAALGIGLQAIVAVRLARHLEREVEAFTRHRIVAHVETSLIFEHERSQALPDLNP